MHVFVVEYSESLQVCQVRVIAVTMWQIPALQGRANRVVDRIEDSYLALCAKVALTSHTSNTTSPSLDQIFTYHKHVDSNLFSLVLEIVDICARHALRCIGQ